MSALHPIELSVHDERNLGVFTHLLYEYQKGLRGLALHTCDITLYQQVVQHLDRYHLSYCIQPINNKRINVFFGDEACVKVVKSFGKKPLNHLTCEEDFILGIMLGYDRQKQCERYLQFKQNHYLPMQQLSTPA